MQFTSTEDSASCELHTNIFIISANISHQKLRLIPDWWSQVFMSWRAEMWTWTAQFLGARAQETRKNCWEQSRAGDLKESKAFRSRILIFVYVCILTTWRRWEPARHRSTISSSFLLSLHYLWVFMRTNNLWTDLNLVPNNNKLPTPCARHTPTGSSWLCFTRAAVFHRPWR